MVTLQKSGDSAVKFVFENSQHYLYGNGEIVVPVNSLLLVEDSSDMVTFKKIDGDIFISARYEEFGMSKAELEAWYKANMVSSGGGGGGGVTPGEVQQMIDSSISGKTDTSAFTAYTAATDSRLAEDEEVSARALNDLDERKLDASAYTPVDLSDYYTTAQTVSAITASVSGKASQSDLETVSGQVANKQDQLVSGTNIKTINNISLLGSGNIDIQGGGGTGGCTVEETVVYETYIDNYNYQPSGDKYEYVILDNHNDKTTDVRDLYFTIGDDSNNYAEGYIRFDYPNHSASTTDESNTALTEYTTIEYISDINDFKVSVASGYQATNWFKTISNLFNISIIVPFYTINSGSPCTVIETDVVGLVEKVKDVVDKSVSVVSLTSQKSKLDLSYSPNKGYGSASFIRLDELDGSNSTLRPDIKIPLGVSGWTELSITSDTCNVYDMNAIKIRVTYDYETFNADYMYITIVSDTDGWEHYDNVSFSWETELPTFYSDYFTGVTISWSAATKELVVEYPPTVDDGGIIKNVKISRLGSSNCQFGQTINKVETYGELKQDLKPYVQETKAALGGLSLVKLTQAEYDALSPNYDSNTLYVIVN